MAPIRFRFLLIAAAAIFLISGCTRNPVDNKKQLNLSGTFKPAGLAGITIRHFSLFGGSLYAATNNGLYQLPLNTPGADSWNSLGLDDKKIIDVAFLPGDSVLAAKQDSDFVSGETTLFLSPDRGKSWQSWQHNYGGDTGKYTYIGALSAVGEQSDTLIALGSGVMSAWTGNGGKKWTLAEGDRWDDWGGVPERVYPDPYYRGRIWAFGVDAFSQPYLFKSTDYGTSWTRLVSIEGPEAVCYDVATNPDNKEAILAGFSGTVSNALQIRKSADNGQTWKVVYTGAGIHALAQSPKDGHIVYASGLYMNNSEPIFFAASNDFGDTWQTVADTTGPTGITTNDLVAATVNGNEVLFFGTNKGVYEYAFSK